MPELVLFLLYATFLMTGIIVGYSSGAGGHRAPFVTYTMVGLIVLLVCIILDLDRPRRGLIEVRQNSMTDLQAMVASTAAAEARNSAHLVEGQRIERTQGRAAIPLVECSPATALPPGSVKLHQVIQEAYW